MERRHDRLKRRHFGLPVRVHGNTATVVGDAHAIIRKKRNLNVVCESTHRFIAGVVKNLGDEVV